MYGEITENGNNGYRENKEKCTKGLFSMAKYKEIINLFSTLINKIKAKNRY